MKIRMGTFSTLVLRILRVPASARTGGLVCALLCSMLWLPSPALSQTILDAFYDRAQDALIVDLAYQGTNPNHDFSLVWDACQTAGGRQAQRGRTFDRRPGQRRGAQRFPGAAPISVDRPRLPPRRGDGSDGTGFELDAFRARIRALTPRWRGPLANRGIPHEERPMCLGRSIGNSGQNELTDVMVFQILFNLNRARFPEPKPANLEPDG